MEISASFLRRLKTGGLAVPANDIEIWDYALINNLIIVTNDDDFLNLATHKGFPSKVVLLHTGNQSNNYL